MFSPRIYPGVLKKGEMIMAISKPKELNWLEYIIHTAYLLYYRCRFGHDIRLISLSRYKFAIIDSADYDHLKNFNWRPRRSLHTWYAFRLALVAEKRDKNLVWLHNEIIENPNGLLIDHINRNGLDNRKINLRLATRAQNTCNCKKRKGCSSKFKGVSYHNSISGPKRWQAYIHANGRRIYLGVFLTEVEAARAYDSAARMYHKEFAQLNFTD